MLKITDEYPDYSGYIAEIKKSGITDALLNKIIDKHLNNARHTRALYDRYKTREDAVPIFERKPRFTHEDEDVKELNNKVNNDFFSEIADIAVGYFAGKAAAYKYADTDEETKTAEEAKKTLEDFVTRNNMYDVNMETTKYATICGYSGRLFYIDTDGNERVMPIAPYECIILYENEMTEPFAAVRYYPVLDINDHESYKAEYYDNKNITFYEGELGSLKQIEKDAVQAHLFNYCPLQGIPRNRELLGDAEKVLALIDDYDKTVSDNSNDIEGNTNAHMVFKNVVISDSEMIKARKRGSFSYNALNDSDVYYLTKNVNDTFNAHHLDRLEDNIYRFSKTPNLNSQEFGTSTGIALKFKITGLESKCGAFEAKMISADTYMYKLLASSFNKKRVDFDPLQCYTTYKRNFPMDLISEAQTVQGLVNAGVPKSVAFEQLSFVDDVEYLLDLIEQEKEDIPSLMDFTPDDEEDEGEEGENKKDPDEPDDNKGKEEEE